MLTLALQRPELIHRLEQLAIDHNTPPEDLLNKAVQEFLERMEQKFAALKLKASLAPPEFLREVAAFERLKPKLLIQYRDHVVAIYQGKVVAVGEDILSTHNKVMEEFGEVVCYVEWVKEEVPRKVRITSSRIKR
ncbi:MAG: hypothetical protein AAF702_04755 [Chloroflexota bacterium]